MKKKPVSLKCFIAASRSRDFDSKLEEHGVKQGLLIFSIPAFGVLFRCRADGDQVEMEFAAFFSLLKFVQDQLKDEKVTVLEIYSSQPKFVFAFTGRTKYLQEGSEHHSLLAEFAKKFQIQVGYIEPARNACLASPADFPSTPADHKIKLQFTQEELTKTSFRPVQRGVDL